MKRVWTSILVLWVCFAAFAGGGQEGQAGKAGGKILLRFSWWGGESRHEGTLAAIEAYESLRPDVAFEPEYSGWSGYYQKLVTQLVGKTAADIIQINPPWVPEFSQQGSLFVPLEDREDIDLSGFDEEFLREYCTIDGHVIGLPTGLNGEGMFFDKQVLDKAGIPADTVWTWENMVTLGKKVHQADPESYLLGESVSGVFKYWTKYISQLSGGIVLDSKEVLFTKEQAVEAFAYFKSWYEEGVIAPINQTALYNHKFNENPKWINRQIAGAQIWASTLHQSKEGRAEEDCLVANIPVMENAVNSGITVRPSQILSVNNHSAFVGEGVAFLNFFFNDERAVSVLKTVRGMPATPKACDILKERNELDPKVVEMTNRALAVRGKTPSVYQRNTELLNTVVEVVEEFCYELDPEKAAEELISRLNEKLAEID